MTTLDWPPEFTHCSRCRDNAAFFLHDEEGWVSECCGARPIPVDPPSWMEDR